MVTRIPTTNQVVSSLKAFAKRHGGRLYDLAANVERRRRRWQAERRRRQVEASNYSNFAGVVGAISRLAETQAYPELLRLADEATKSGQTGARAQFIRDFAPLCVAVRVSAYDEAVGHADRIVAAGNPSFAQLHAILEPTTYEHLIDGIATSLTRVGRYPDAAKLLAAEIDSGRGDRRLLRARAEIAWPHDPELAMDDLLRLHRLGSLSPADELLYGFLETIHPNSPRAGKIPLGRGGQLDLIAAMRAHNRGDFVAYADAVNAMFTEQGVTAPIPPSATHFDYAELDSTAPRAPSGPLVSVIMTTFNAETTLGYAVESILRQSYGNLEVFIVDDLSTDRTRDMLRAIAARDSRVRILLNDVNGGTYVAKNRAMQEAKGEFITFHDADDWAHPQRIERHLRTMQDNPGAMLSRSNWMRVTSDGAIEFCRWGKRILHPNPASMFIRREVVDRIGYFDSVRVSADTEYRLRIRVVYGLPAIVTMRDCLGLGGIVDASLTRSGAGALNIDKYSKPRVDYSSAYWKWYVGAKPEELYLPAVQERRKFPAPASMLPDASRAEALNPPTAAALRDDSLPPLVFGISLASKQVSTNWARTEELLGHTLRSLLAQTDQRFDVIICGHERPALAEMNDPRVRFLAADNRPPTDPHRFRGDKMRKRRLIGAALRRMGGGYFVPLDADDLLHRDFAAHVRSTDNRRGYVVMAGYALDYGNQLLAPVPGVWGADYNRVCGSSAAIFFREDELPVDGENDETLYFNLFQSHAYWPVLAEEYGRKLEPLPFSAGVYVLNHSQNLSFGLQRKGDRTQNILDAVKRDAIAEGGAVLREQFGWRSA